MTITTRLVEVLRAEGRVARFNIEAPLEGGGTVTYREVTRAVAREILERHGLKPERAVRIIERLEEVATFAGSEPVVYVAPNDESIPTPER